MEPPKAPLPSLVDQFVAIVSRSDGEVFHSFNKFMYPVVPISGSNFGHLPEFAFPDGEAVRLKQDIRMYEFGTFATSFATFTMRSCDPN